MIRSILVLLAFSAPAAAASVDDFTTNSCTEVDAQFAGNGRAIIAFNESSHAAIDALKVGDRENGCRSLRSVLAFTERSIKTLEACALVRPSDHDLAQSFFDVQHEIERVGKREGCFGRQAPGS